MLYNRFINAINNSPSISGTLFEILNNGTLVRKYLKELFPEEIDLDIYIATDDRYSTFVINGTLRNYLQRERIDFDYNDDQPQ